MIVRVNVVIFDIARASNHQRKFSPGKALEKKESIIVPEKLKVITVRKIQNAKFPGNQS